MKGRNSRTDYAHGLELNEDCRPFPRVVSLLGGLHGSARLAVEMLPSGRPKLMVGGEDDGANGMLPSAPSKERLWDVWWLYPFGG